MRNLITIGIPAYNEEKNIRNCIENILGLDLKIPFEILVITSGCTDRTNEIVENLMEKNNEVRLIKLKKLNTKSAKMNILLKNAKGDIVVQTDADVLIQKEAIQKIVKHFQDPKVGLVSGRPVPVISVKSKFYDWVQMSYDFMHQRRIEEEKQQKFWHVSGYLCAIRKSAWTPIPDDSIIDDAVFGLLIWKENWRVEYEPTAKVAVKPPMSTKDFIKQRARNRAGFAQIRKRYGLQPRTVSEEFSSYFLKSIKRLDSTQKFGNFLLIGSVYLYSWIYSYWQLFRKLNPLEIWKPIKSSK